MKKIPLLLLVAFLTSCSDSFLELYPKDTLNEGNFYKTETEFILLANGCYVPMRNYEKNQHWVLAELISDNGSKQNNIRTGEASRGVIDQFILGSDNAAYEDFWDQSYNGITRCNKLLSELNREGVTFSKESLKDRSAGEALFLRALYYFNLVRQFGGVPLVTTPITSQEAVGIKRSTEEQVYAQIVQDLTEAIGHFAKASDVAETGRANEWAARGMLGKVQLTLKKYPEAQQALLAVINSGKYQLLPNYADLFNPANKDYKETIFAMQYSEASVEVANQFIFQFAPAYLRRCRHAAAQYQHRECRLEPAHRRPDQCFRAGRCPERGFDRLLERSGLGQQSTAYTLPRQVQGPPHGPRQPRRATTSPFCATPTCC